MKFMPALGACTDKGVLTPLLPSLYVLNLEAWYLLAFDSSWLAMVDTSGSTKICLPKLPYLF